MAGFPEGIPLPTFDIARKRHEMRVAELKLRVAERSEREFQDTTQVQLRGYHR